MVYVYILRSLVDKGYYIGITKNIEERIKKHNSGKVKSTSKRRPFILIRKEELEDYKMARKREIELKSYKGGNKLKDLLK